MTTYNINCEIEQEQRIQQDIAALEHECDRATDLNSDGQFDGSIGLDPDPKKWEELSYRTGYILGIERYWDNKFWLNKLTAIF